MPVWAPSDIFAEISREMEADLMEQKVHELDARLRQMKEKRDQVIAENDELQVSKHHKVWFDIFKLLKFNLQELYIYLRPNVWTIWFHTW